MTDARRDGFYWVSRIIAVAAVAAALAIGHGLHAQGQAPPAATAGRFDDAGVRAAVMQRIQGQQSRNAAVSASIFADDAVWINAFGVRRVGRSSIEKFLADLYADPGFAQAQFAPAQIEEIVFVRPDVAVARTFTRIEGQRLPNGATLAERRTHNTMTLTHEPGGWMVRYEVVTDERTAPQR